MRLETESHFKQAVREARVSSQAQEYVAINYYGKFLKDTVDHLQKEEKTKTKINTQFLRQLFFDRWLVSEDLR